MPNSNDLMSPKQAAQAMGVSESSLKRWCDQGLIQTVRTPGGHRKLRKADVLRFVRESGHTLAVPELLGLPVFNERTKLGLKKGQAEFFEALLANREDVARQIILELYLAKHSWSVLFDDVITPSLHRIGKCWANHEIEIYQERRCCDITLRILHELHRWLTPLPETRLAMGGTLAGDNYAVPTAMVEMLLRSLGFQANSLGTAIPIASHAQAVEKHRPLLYWLSISHIQDKTQFVAEFNQLSQICHRAATHLVVGGQALTQPVRSQIIYTVYCDKMQHLEAFATTLLRSRRPVKKRRANLK